MRTNLGLLEKQFVTMNYKKVRTLGAQGAESKAYESTLEEKTSYFDHQLEGF